jgi:hypothetical protein
MTAKKKIMNKILTVIMAFIVFVMIFFKELFYWAHIFGGLFVIPLLVLIIVLRFMFSWAWSLRPVKTNEFSQPFFLLVFCVLCAAESVFCALQASEIVWLTNYKILCHLFDSNTVLSNYEYISLSVQNSITNQHTHNFTRELLSHLSVLTDWVYTKADLRLKTFWFESLLTSTELFFKAFYSVASLLVIGIIMFFKNNHKSHTANFFFYYSYILMYCAIAMGNTPGAVIGLLIQLMYIYYYRSSISEFVWYIKIKRIFLDTAQTVVEIVLYVYCTVINFFLAIIAEIKNINQKIRDFLLSTRNKFCLIKNKVIEIKKDLVLLIKKLKELWDLFKK